MWNEITNQNDLDDFMNLFGDFHDSCLKECRYISGAYVNEDLSMYPINNKRIFTVIFQRQLISPSVIEMEFSGLQRLRMNPVDENYTCEILDATMIIIDNYICWYDSVKLSEDELCTYNGVLICARRVRWRATEEYIGHGEIYAR